MFFFPSHELSNNNGSDKTQNAIRDRDVDIHRLPAVGISHQQQDHDHIQTDNEHAVETVKYRRTAKHAQKHDSYDKNRADILKLDKGMLNGINTDRRQMTIFWKIIEMAHSIGMQVICEGIETREQYADLRMLRCDIGQGFLVSRAIAATEFAEKYLR